MAWRRNVKASYLSLSATKLGSELFLLELYFHMRYLLALKSVSFGSSLGPPHKPEPVWIGSTGLLLITVTTFKPPWYTLSNFKEVIHTGHKRQDQSPQDVRVEGSLWPEDPQTPLCHSSAVWQVTSPLWNSICSSWKLRTVISCTLNYRQIKNTLNSMYYCNNPSGEQQFIIHDHLNF